MKDFTLRKRFLDSKSGTSSLFKGFVMLVVLMLMTTSSAMAQEAKYEVIDGFRYLLESDTKTAMLLPKKEGKYSGDIIIPEKVKGNDGVEYIVASLGTSCFKDCSGLTSITIPSSVTSLDWHCFEYCQNLESVIFKGRYCNYVYYPDLKIPTTCIIKVPTEYLQDYKNAFGPNYQYIYAWNPDGTGEDNKPVTQCSTPSISYDQVN